MRLHIYHLFLLLTFSILLFLTLLYLPFFHPFYPTFFSFFIYSFFMDGITVEGNDLAESKDERRNLKVQWAEKDEIKKKRQKKQNYVESQKQKEE